MITNPPVKINLGLNVINRRADGFHDIQTLFYPATQIHDTLEIISGDDYSRTSARLAGLYGDLAKITDLSAPDNVEDCADDDFIPTLAQGISCNGKLMITVARKEGVDWPVMKDLCAKAYMMLDEEYGLPPVKIYLEKTSPVGAGLGGGSADAAYTLKMLAEMFSLDIDEEKLREYAAKLGSDCAFFVSDSPMIGEGRGEVLTPYNLNINIVEDEASAKPGDYLLKIIVPEEIHVSTADAYKGIVPSIPEHSLKDILDRPAEEWKDLLVNDFERTVFVAHPEIEAIKRSLYDSGATYASMSGSGSALFALYKV